MTLPDVPSIPTAGTRRLRRGRLGALLLTPVAVLAAAALGAQPATANPAGPHDPIGKVVKVSATTDGSLHFTGWAADPDTTANVKLLGLTDGRWTASGSTSIADAAVAQKYHTGPTPDFDMTVRVPATGTHTVCVAVRNVGTGLSRVLTCVATPLGRKLSSQELNLHNPVSTVTSTTAGATSLRVTGWAKEPDYIGSRLVAVLYVDGQSAATVLTHAATAKQVAAGAGGNGAFDISVPVSAGAHLACLWIVNTGLGSNTSPGCTTADTRGRPATGPVKVPAANPKVVAEAKRHIGQRYVWGAAGPKTFDCSGLVLYSYHKAGLSTPRIAADQFTAARLIPASRAVPGDLVFYHDSVGSVFHVGIYLAPNDTVAAIDEQEGIAHQHIWDPSSASYGSFTHT